MISFDKTYSLICNNIEKNIPFTFSRFGDGEWFAIFGKKRSNCDQHIYYKDMGDRLRKIVSVKRGNKSTTHRFNVCYTLLYPVFLLCVFISK